MRSTSALKRTGFPGMYLYSYREGYYYCSLVIVYDLFYYYPITDDHYIVSRFSGHLFFSEFRYGSVRTSVYKSCQLDR